MTIFNNMQLKWKLGMGFAVPLVLLVVIALSANSAINKLIGTQTWVTHTYEAIELGELITVSLVNMETGLRGYLITGDEVFLEPFDKGSKDFKSTLGKGKEHVSDNAKQVDRLKEVQSLKKEWLEEHVNVAMNLRAAANRSGSTVDLIKVTAFIKRAVGKAYMDRMRSLVDEFVAEEKALVVTRGNEQKETAESATFLTSMGALVAVLLGIAAAALILRNVTKALGGDPARAKEMADRIAKGDLSKNIELRGGDADSLMFSLSVMQKEMRERIERDQRVMAEFARVKLALDVCNTNVMMADADLNIIYMNDSVEKTMMAAEKDLRTDLPNFNSRELMGQNIDVFHKNPAHQRTMLSKLQAVYETRILVGGRTFGLVATPIFSDDKTRLGTVVEWDDMTERLALEKTQLEIAADNARIKTALDKVTANVMMADADRNIIYTNDAVIATLRNAQNDIRTELPNFNVDNLLGNSIDQFHKNPNHQMQMLDRLTNTMSSDIVVGGRHMNLIVSPVSDAEGSRLGSVVEWTDRTAEVQTQIEMDKIIAASNDGDLSERIPLEGKEGFFRSMSEGLNSLLDKTAMFVEDMGAMFEAMSDGDLTRKVNNEYRGEFEIIANNANNTVLKLTEVMWKIQGASGTVRTSANEVAQGSDDLSRRTESQASSLEETAASMEEITATVKQTSENASQANTLASDAKLTAQTGGAVVNDAVNAMSEILDSSNKINDIIGVIDEIAFQTNLLALNAAVEAARAGEQGRGFAVVAGEVRTLSQRSAAAAKEIKDLIRDSVNKVESGSTLVNQSGKTLAEIVTAVDKVAVMIQDVNNAAIEQNSGISQINQAITQMDEMTQQNAALVEETSAASRSMSEEATSMNNLISFFKLNGQAAAASTVSASMSAPASESIQTYSPAPATPGPQSGADGVASFSESDDWEDF